MSTIITKLNGSMLHRGRKKLKPIMSQKNIFINRSIPFTTKNHKKNKKIFHRNISNGELSVLLFQDNEVDLVRSLNPDQDRDICSNILLKGQLKNNIINNNEFHIRQNNNKSVNNSINLPKIKKMTINSILESDQRLNQNKKDAQKNLAYSLLENELCGELKKIREEYNKKKEEKNNIYINFRNISDKIDEMNLEIQIINSKNFMENLKEKKTKLKEEEKMMKENLEKNNKIKQNLIDTISKELPEISEGLDMNKFNIMDTEESKKYSNDIENKMNKIKNLYLMKKNSDFEKKIKFDKINQLKEELNKINEPLEQINKELNELRKKEKTVINKLMIHYETLLYKGEEVRNEGLIWIIKAMWTLGQNVPMSFIPPFLDFQSIEFLFQYAHKSIQLENTKKILNELKNDLQVQIHNLFYNSKSPEKYNSSFEFKTDLIKKNKISKTSIKESNFIKAYINDDNDENEKNTITIKEMSNIIANKQNKIDFSKLKGIEKLDELKSKIKEIEEEILVLKKKETNRLFKEFVANDYQNKYHVSIDVVLAALLGEHCKNIEINKYSKFKKEYLDELKNIRFYQYGQDKNSI